MRLARIVILSALTASLPFAATAVETGSLDKSAATKPAQAPSEKPTGATAPPQPAPEVHPAAMAVRQRLADRKLDASAEERQAIAQAYEARSGAPLWADAQGLTEKAKRVIAEIARADDWGLPSNEFAPAGLPGKPGPMDAAQIANAEVQVSLAVLKYARFARGGRISDPSQQLASTLDRKPQLIEPKTVLERVASTTTPDIALRRFNPQNAEFEALRRAYLSVRNANAAGDDEDELADVPSLRPGMSHPAVAVVRQRLKIALPAVDGDKAGDLELFDPDMVEAVVAFQTANGLEPADGIIGPKTRALITSLRPPSARTLLANMEQWRWMPEDLGLTHITVNIPEFTVRMVKNNGVIHSERVVTGLVTNQTPVFSNALQTVVLQPDWVLPESIKVNEAIPSLLGRGGMFWSSGLKIKRGQTDVDPGSVNWGSVDTRIYTFYQPPGPSNALGQVKFLFPNKHAVYMHDTPSKHLFEKAERAFSHGCMRVRNPVKLAELVLMHDKGWTAEHVTELLEDGPEDNKIALFNKIPVHVTYFTAVPDENGRIRRLPDIYGHEERISLALEGRFGDIDIPADHLAPVEDREFEYRSAAVERRQQGDRDDDQPAKKKGGDLENAIKSIFGGF